MTQIESSATAIRITMTMSISANDKVKYYAKKMIYIIITLAAVDDIYRNDNGGGRG